MIPVGHFTEDGFALGQWQSAQRQAYQRGQLTLSEWNASGCSLLSLRTACGRTNVRAMTKSTMRKPQSRGAWRESRAHLLSIGFIRGESRRCKGSIEPLLKLPDGALATRRIVSFLLRCCGGRASQACGSKGVQLSSCVG